MSRNGVLGPARHFAGSTLSDMPGQFPSAPPSVSNPVPLEDGRATPVRSPAIIYRAKGNVEILKNVRVRQEFEASGLGNTVTALLAAIGAGE